MPWPDNGIQGDHYHRVKQRRQDCLLPAYCWNSDWKFRSKMPNIDAKASNLIGPIMRTEKFFLSVRISGCQTPDLDRYDWTCSQNVRFQEEISAALQLAYKMSQGENDEPILLLQLSLYHPLTCVASPQVRSALLLPCRCIPADLSRGFGFWRRKVV